MLLLNNSACFYFFEFLCSATCRRGHVKMDPAKKAKSVILNPHLWSLKRLQQRPRGRPRKHPAPGKFKKSDSPTASGKQNEKRKSFMSFKAINNLHTLMLKIKEHVCI